MVCICNYIMNSKCFLIVLSLITSSMTVNISTSTNSYLTFNDKLHLKKVLEPGFHLQELSEVYYSVSGYKYLKETISKVAEICEFLIKSSNNSLSSEQIYYLVHTWSLIERCQPKSFPLDTITKTLTAVLEQENSIPELYYAIDSLILLDKKIADLLVTKLLKIMQTALKKDDNPLNLGYIFHIAANLGTVGNFAFNHIENAIVQADEVDGQFLQFEGGLSITSHLINGVFKLSSVLKRKPPLTSQQTIKLVNYFFSRRSVQTPKGVVNFLSSINILASNEFEKPICITLTDDGFIVSIKQPLVRIKVCDLLGNPLISVTNVVANTATKIGNYETIINKKIFQSTANDKTLFTLNFMDTMPEPGFYNVVLSAAFAVNTIMIKVLTEVKIDYLEIGTADADQTTQPKLVNIVHPQILNEKIEADFQQKLVIRFLLKDTHKNKPMKAHQAFVRLSSTSLQTNKQEIIFIAEVDTSFIYKFDLPISLTAKNFAHQSGDYNIELIIGDAILSNSFQWIVATVNLKFPELAGAEVTDKLTYKQKFNVYSQKPEIKHMFRQPEKRPPAFISNLFTILCSSPILILIILWTKLGINISNFPFSLNTIIFHMGLASIFILFGIFWLKLNMFTALRYLFGLGLITFLSGNKLLAQIAYNRKMSR